MAIIVPDTTGWPPTLNFDAHKAVQSLAFFLKRADSAVDKMKLIKLLYIADRESFAKRGRPMNFDEFYSMKDGPVVSSALNGINGSLSGRGAIWKAISLASDKKTVTLKSDPGEDHLSASDVEILEDVWERFGGKTAGQLRYWTHKNCPEYTDVTGSRMPIGYDDILNAVGAEDADQRAREIQRLQRELGRLPKAHAP